MILLLHQSIEHWATVHPDKIAFKSPNKSFTYREANHTANQIACKLIKNGLHKGDKVGILISRNAYSPIAVHATLKAGGVFVPIDPESPPNRIEYILEDCEIKHLITEQSQVAILKNIKQNELTIYGTDDTYSWSDLQQQTKVFNPISINQHELAYIIYTSGTTGHPKGIMHTHYSGLSYAKLSKELYNIGNNDFILNHSPLHYDMSTLGYLTAPFAGATSFILPKMYSSFPASLSQLIEKEQVTILYCVPLILLLLLTH